MFSWISDSYVLCATCNWVSDFQKWLLIFTDLEMPRRKVTRAAKTKKTSRVSDENEVEISNKEREKLETYLKDFDTRGNGLLATGNYTIIIQAKLVWTDYTTVKRIVVCT